MEMTYREAVDNEANHILNFIDSYDESDIANILQSLKINMIAIVDGNGDKQVNTLDEDELFNREITI